MITDILQPTHLLFILVVALLVLGPKRLPEVGRSLGNGLRGFKDAMSGIEAQASDLLHDHEPTVKEPVEAPPVVVASSSAAEAPTVVASSSREPDQADYAD